MRKHNSEADGMKIFKAETYRKMKDPTPPGKALTKVLTREDNAKELEGIFVVFAPVRYGRYHYHKKRECVFIVISGKATAKIEDKEYTIEAGDIIYLSAGEKHTITNESDEEFRFFEFYTHPPHEADWIAVKAEAE